MASIVDGTRGPHPILRDLGYLPRVTNRDGRAIEEALAPATLLDDGARLDGAIIEASYAFRRPPAAKATPRGSRTPELSIRRPCGSPASAISSPKHCDVKSKTNFATPKS